MALSTYTMLFLQLAIGGMAATSQETTLVVFHTPSDGVILATDSAVGSVTIGEIKSGRATPKSFGTACKIEKCGRYLVAEAGFGGLVSKSNKSASATRCSEIGDRPSNIQFVSAYRRLAVLQRRRNMDPWRQTSRREHTFLPRSATACGLCPKRKRAARRRAALWVYPAVAGSAA